MDETKTIPEDLQASLNSARALATCYNLLQQAPFPNGFHPTVEQSLKFLESLHSQVMAEAQAHPDAAIVPELQKLKEGTNV